MKHFAAKSLAALGAAVILFIICFSLAVGTADNTAGSGTAYELSSWLAKNDITIDRSIIDTDTKYAAAVTMKSAVSDRASAAAGMLGTCSGTAADTYTGARGVVVFSKDSFTLTPADGLFADEFSGLDRYNCGKRAESAAKELGFNISGSVISAEENNGSFSAVITKTVDSVPVFDDRITLSMTRGGLVSASGVWYVPESSGGRRPAKSAADALGDLLNETAGSGRVTVRSMEFGYLLDHEGNTTQLKPVWRFELDSRDDFYTDA